MEKIYRHDEEKSKSNFPLAAIHKTWQLPKKNQKKKLNYAKASNVHNWKRKTRIVNWIHKNYVQVKKLSDRDSNKKK